MELRERILQLATAAGIDTETERVTEDRCWVDGRVRCPYGYPSGQYILRPEAYCHNLWSPGDGCLVFHEHVEDQELTEQQKKDAVTELFQARKQPLSERIRARAEELPDGCAERLSIELAADVMDDRNLRDNILLEEDTP